ncbi:unnamed protein product [Ascophyllum nodosum]
MSVLTRGSGGGVGVPPEQENGAGHHLKQRHGDGKRRLPKSSEPDPWLAGTAPPCKTALEMSRDSARLDRLSFGCAALDAAFDGGVPVQGITEIAGEAGAGKTQLCLQLLLQAQLPPEAGGLGGKSYVLTCGEGKFPSRRLKQMASRQQKRCRVEPERLMDGVCIQNARNLEEQMKIMMEHLPVLMEAHGIRLVVIDSIAALFRSDLGRGRGDMGERSRLLGQLSQQMKRLGDRHRAAFVVVNQVTARPGVAKGAAGGAVGRGRDCGNVADGNVPAMGMLWSHCINTRLWSEYAGIKRNGTCVIIYIYIHVRGAEKVEGGALWSFVVLVATGTEYRQTVPCHPRLIYTSVLCILAMKDLGNVPPSVFAPSTASPPHSPLPRFMVRRRELRLPLRPSISSIPNDSEERQQQQPAEGGGRSTAVVREITLQLSPCIPIHTSCAFVIERDGISSAGTLTN